MLKYINIKNVVGYILRRIGTNNIETHYIPDIKMYIADAFEELEVTTTLSRRSQQITIDEHLGDLPSDMHEMIAVIDTHSKQRIPLASTELDYPNQKDSINYQYKGSLHGDEWSKVFTASDLSVESSLEPVDGHSHHLISYYIQWPRIVLTEPTMLIEATYWGVNIDEEGYPLIPDYIQLKNAMYWYVLMNLVASGYKHKVFQYDYCRQMYESKRVEATSSMKEFTPEHANRLNKSLNQLIKSERMWNDAFNIAEHGWD